ncbi:MAG TPA: hypothetical protein PK349_00730 [Candidatus Hydrogenedentes bacterium]|nr:hypothetical protein [Candidatus Hydrogenedentota bacterium]
MPNRKGERALRPSRPVPLAIRWQYTRRCFTVDLPPWREFFRWETLESAVEHHLVTRDNWMLPALEALENGASVTSLKFDLAAAMEYQFLFDLTVGYAHRRVRNVVLCVARNDREYAVPFREGWNGLVRLSGKVPHYCAKPLRLGKIFLPDRYNRNAFHRDLPAALVQLPGARWNPITPVAPDQLGLREKAGTAPALLSRQETIRLQVKLAKVLLMAYDAERRIGPVIDPDHAWEWMAWREKGEKEPGLCLVSAITKWTRCAPERYLARLLASTIRGAKAVLPVFPEDPFAAWDCLRASGFSQKVPGLGGPSFLPEKPPDYLSRDAWSPVIRKYTLLREHRPGISPEESGAKRT